MKKKASLFTLCFENGKIVWGAVYNDYLGGQKLVGCGTVDGSPEHKAQLRDIIADDANNYSKWHWAEVSGPLEHWFKKYNGYPIPVEFIPTLLDNRKEIIPLSDGAHYKRLLNGGIEITKIMYGFKDQTVFDNVTKEYENYYDFRFTINNSNEIHESIERIAEDYNTKTNVREPRVDDFDNNVKFAVHIMKLFNKMINDGAYDLTGFMNSCLNWALSTLKTVQVQNKLIKKCIIIGETMVKYRTILKCNRFKPIEDLIISPAL